MPINNLTRLAALRSRGRLVRERVDIIEEVIQALESIRHDRGHMAQTAFVHYVSDGRKEQVKKMIAEDKEASE